MKFKIKNEDKIDIPYMISESDIKSGKGSIKVLDFIIENSLNEDEVLKALKLYVKSKM